MFFFLSFSRAPYCARARASRSPHPRVWLYIFHTTFYTQYQQFPFFFLILTRVLLYSNIFFVFLFFFFSISLNDCFVWWAHVPFILFFLVCLSVVLCLCLCACLPVCVCVIYDQTRRDTSFFLFFIISFYLHLFRIINKSRINSL